MDPVETCLSGKCVLYNHQLQLSYKYSKISPTLSSFYMSEVLRETDGIQELEKQTETAVCPFCGVIRTPENCRVRFHPRIKKTKNVKRLKNKFEFKTKNISTKQKKILKLLESNTNQMVINCAHCKKKLRIRSSIPQEKPVPDPTIKNRKPKRKRRKKDPTAGLTIPASVTNNKNQETQSAAESIEIKIKNTRDATTNIQKKAMIAGRNTSIQPMYKKKNKKINKIIIPSQRETLESFLSSLL